MLIASVWMSQHCDYRQSKHFHRSVATMTAKSNYSIDCRGPINSTDYRIYFREKNNGKIISPWHDIPLFADKAQRIMNMIVEIPRWSNAKMEISTKEPLSPIKQDVKKGVLRFVHNVFPHKGYIWNYGAFPQTWENPDHVDQSTNAKGDNDPIDVLEIGSRVANRGDVLQVKILGTIALIDEGETDWKILSIDINDPLANQINDIDDVEKHFPGLLRASVEWFKIYKIPDGKPPNQFAFNGEAKNKEFAEKIVQETHEFWQEFMRKEGEVSLNRKNTTLNNTESLDENQSNTILEERGQKTETLQPEPLSDPSAIEKWHFVKLI
ncbi:Inorganic pyrophosphatase [Sarcoptes scabiei]|nr:Inorganic pyrophosphatase [Sarcoptes scabiei]